MVNPRTVGWFADGRPLDFSTSTASRAAACARSLWPRSGRP